ncbi:MAG TPA: hypothetical protein VLA66_13370, partial [Thermoanaerobaculia bacterium]|nr:hypothetical protein [Thermoanaerobaculia bacterium]
MSPPYRSALIWLAVLVASAPFVSWSFPAVFPFAPSDWGVGRSAAEGIALDAIERLGELPEGAYVVTSTDDSSRLEYRMLEARRAGAAGLEAGDLPERIFYWRVRVYPPGARPTDWSYTARISMTGRVLSLERGFQDGFLAPAIDEAAALSRAREFLVSEGVDLGRFELPSARRRELEKRTDWVVRFVERERVLGAGLPYGLEVSFAGDQLGGYRFFLDDPDQDSIDLVLR